MVDLIYLHISIFYFLIAQKLLKKCFLVKLFNYYST